MERKHFKDTGIIMVSRKLAELTTLEAAAVYGALLPFRAESVAAGKTFEIDGKIFFTVLQEEIAADTALTIRRIRPAIAKLIEIGVLEKQQRNFPNMTLYHIVPDRMLELYDMKGGDL